MLCDVQDLFLADFNYLSQDETQVTFSKEFIGYLLAWLNGPKVIVIGTLYLVWPDISLSEYLIKN